MITILYLQQYSTIQIFTVNFKSVNVTPKWTEIDVCQRKDYPVIKTRITMSSWNAFVNEY